MANEISKNKATSLTKRFASSNGYRFLSPITIKGKKQTSTLDAVVVGYFGVLAVKTINYDNGVVYGTINDEEWLWVDKKEKRTFFPNPIKQAQADVRTLRDALFAYKLQQTPIEVVCVFTAKNKKLQLALPASTGHYTLKDFKQLLRKEKYKNDVGLDIDKVANAFEAAK